MYPWYFLWTPQIYFPWSGDIIQRINPNTNWFSDMISPDAGNAEMEKNAFEIASYGKQLGLITEILIEIAEDVTPKSDAGKESLRRLKRIQQQIESKKSDNSARLAERVLESMESLRARSPEAYRELLRRLGLAQSEESGRG